MTGPNVMFEDTKDVIRSRKSKDRQHNDQKKKRRKQIIKANEMVKK